MSNLALSPSKPEIKTVRWHHEAIIDQIIANPRATQGEIAQACGFTQTWMSIIVNSDAFKERLAERRAELVDPVLTASIEDRLNAVAKRSLDRIIERLDTNAPMKNRELVDIAKLGIADRFSGPSVQQNNLYVIQAPPKASSTEAWQAQVSDAIPAQRSLP